MSLTEFIDSNMEETTNLVDELLVSSVTEDTLSELPAVQVVAKPQIKRREDQVPVKKSRAKSDSQSKVKSAKTGTKRKAAAVELHQDGDQLGSELIETEPPKAKGRPRKVATSEGVDEEASDFVETEAPKAKARKTAAKKTKDTTTVTAKPRSKKAIGTADLGDEDEPIPSPVNIRSNFTQTKTAKALPKPIAEKNSRATSKTHMKAKSRPVQEVVTEAEESGPEEIQEEPQPRKRQRTASVCRQQEPVYRRRAGSVSDSERGDPMLRRKLGDVTRKFENVDLKYKNLKEVGVTEANANVEKLRKQCEAIAEKSDKLVASLRKELAQQALLLQETRKQKKEVQINEAEVGRLRAANDGLSATLAAAQEKMKTLETKLAAAKAVPAPEPVKQAPPPPAPKAVVPARNGNINSNQNQNDKESQLKLALYADLTDLLIQNVKQTEDGDTYDCIQTGRNGSLHFKLFVDAENLARARSSPNSQELDILYTPQIHAERDKELIAIMPEYLTEELSFERAVASKFYARVVKTLVEQPQVVEEDDEGETEA